MAGLVAQWVVPAAAESGRQRLTVYTERYQEAALIRWYTGIPARTLPGCGRRSQDDLDDLDGDGFVPATDAWFVRPARSGPPACAIVWYGAPSAGPHPIRPLDPSGRAAGAWDLFELGADPR
jgi:hypothetical protein